nr:MAG TPA: hypothetical protein [Caudoviricetes sp.]
MCLIILLVLFKVLVLLYSPNFETNQKLRRVKNWYSR